MFTKFQWKLAGYCASDRIINEFYLFFLRFAGDLDSTAFCFIDKINCSTDISLEY